MRFSLIQQKLLIFSARKKVPKNVLAEIIGMEFFTSLVVAQSPSYSYQKNMQLSFHVILMTMRSTKKYQNTIA